jgi:hypothetical protein
MSSNQFTIAPELQALFPEAVTAHDLYEAVDGDAWDAEGGEFDNGTESWTHRYTFTAGVWMYVRDADNLADCTYRVCGSKREARQAYRNAIIAACIDWTPENGAVWFDCGYDNDSVVQLGEAGLIPTGTYTD